MNLKSYDAVYVEAATEILIKDYRKQFTTQQIATKIGIAERKLERLFKKRYNMGIYKFQLTIRMQKAKELLEDGNKSIKEVAVAVGYKRQGSFTKRFYKFFGTSPSEWEKMN